ncbi:Wzz/FepE/Etk N-terminal domain-containing protein [Reichenbachiella sp. MALMAid0571]|uniref:Wzz/FepE/Etk N-terminal domain-containing protein n=1 Tax=Reichenbachiella sp. MALMAid0571 TaxID=3143939 RepID=UPI0032E04AC0
MEENPEIEATKSQGQEAKGQGLKANGRIVQEDEIDLIELAKTIWAGRRLIVKITSVFVILGLIIAFTSKVEYEASCKLLPESQEGMKSSLGGLSGLAGLAGINLDMGGAGVLTPELYPEIAKSLPFQLQILKDTLTFENQNIRTTAFHYFKEIDKPTLLGYIAKYTIGLPGLIKSIFTEDAETNEIIQAKDEPIRISKEDWKLIELFKGRINISVDSKSGMIDISVEMPDPLAAASLTEKVVALLTDEVTEYKINKARNNLNFVQASFIDAKKEFETIHLALAKMTDQNRNVSSALAEIELQRIQNEYNVAFEVYKGLASQVEQAKIKLKEEMPVFTVLEPIIVPVEKSNMRKLHILIISILLGAALSALYIIFKNPILGLISDVTKN